MKVYSWTEVQSAHREMAENKNRKVILISMEDLLLTLIYDIPITVVKSLSRLSVICRHNPIAIILLGVDILDSPRLGQSVRVIVPSTKHYSKCILGVMSS